MDFLDTVLALLHGFLTVYTWTIFSMSSSIHEATAISRISESSERLPPARFMVSWICDPVIPSFIAAFFESRLVFDPVSNSASISTKFPSAPFTFTFWMGHSPIPCLNSFSWSAILIPSILWFWEVTCSCEENGSALGFRDWCSFLSLCKDLWWFFLHLSQEVPSGFLQSLVWCDPLKHLRHLFFCWTTSQRWLIVNFW